MPDSKQVIKKGTPIVISLIGLHRDAQHFPDPLSYQPERFLEGNKNFNQNAYLGFGEGPRHCIGKKYLFIINITLYIIYLSNILGARMGKVNVKLALAKVLSNFDLEINQEKREIEFALHGIPLLPKGGVPVRLSLKK